MKSLKIRTLYIFLCLTVLLPFQAQTERTANVILEHAESLTFDKARNAERQVLKHNVRFRHEGAVMYCDSAYFYADRNSLDAFGNVRMIQGDTLFVYSDVLFYDGNAKMAYLRYNVKMINRDVTLTTDSLNYDRQVNVGYYFEDGQITDETNVLTSRKGYYYPNLKEAIFRRNVVLTNDDSLIIRSDTLRYRTDTKVAYILGPSTIENRDGHIYSEWGSYNTETQFSSLFNRSQVRNNDGKFLTADTIFYDKANGIARTFGNAEIRDTVRKIILRGNVGYYNELTEKSLMTNNALAVEYSSGADSLFLHADTLLGTKDSTFNLLRAFRAVRFFRSDVQGKCDSLSYSTRDSLMSMFFDPVLWSENNQLTGNLIQVFMRDSVIDHIFVQGNALAVMQDDDSTKFSQLSGKEIKGFLHDNELFKIEVKGNAESIYFPRESDGTLIGVNRTESSFLTAFLVNNKIEKVILFPGASGKMMPIEETVHEDIFFPNFKWLDDIRPKRKEDIFIRTEPVPRKEERRRRR